MADKFKACSVPDCNGNSHYTENGINGLCNKHRLRSYRHGDPLAGGVSLSHKGEPERFYRDSVLTYGGSECLIWPYARIPNGYGTIKHQGKTTLVHRRVCEDVIGAPPTPQHDAAHSCGKGHLGCVSPHHLSWKTKSENQADRILHGTHQRGERNKSSKITEEQAKEIIFLKGKEKQNDIAKRYGVTREAISKIHSGKNWSWLQG